MGVFTPLAFGALILVLSGCATDTGQCRRPVGDRGLTPAVAAASGENLGERVSWGGTLVEARNRERDTELEVIGMSLGGCGRPRTGSAAVGRFVVVRPGGWGPGWGNGWRGPWYGPGYGYGYPGYWGGYPGYYGGYPYGYGAAPYGYAYPGYGYSGYAYQAPTASAESESSK